jgi:hypothetical protein
VFVNNIVKLCQNISACAILAALAIPFSCIAAQAEQPQQAATTKNVDPDSPSASAKQIAPAVWPEGTTVAGRVVDFQGSPVANAEVIVLGEERMIVDIKPLGAQTPKNWFVQSPKRRFQEKPPSTRTDVKGNFSLKCTEGPANRIAVIADDPVFWIVFRDALPREGEVKIALPQSGNLVVHCDLPGKLAKVPVNIQLHTFNELGWDGDFLRFHFAEQTIDNPGDAVFENLPPGKCAVERNQMVQIGENAQLINLADRQLVDIESNKAAGVRFEHKIGKSLTGRVRGLENVDLASAHVTISRFAPEEVLSKDGRRGGMATAFDVVSIHSDGNFTTDPIPPGKYWVDLQANRPKQPLEGADYSGRVEFTVSESGEMPKVEFDAKPVAPPTGR